MKAKNAAQLERWLRDPETILQDLLAAQEATRTPKRKRHDPQPLHVMEAMRKGRERARKKRGWHKGKPFAKHAHKHPRDAKGRFVVNLIG